MSHLMACLMISVMLLPIRQDEVYRQSLIKMNIFKAKVYVTFPFTVSVCSNFESFQSPDALWAVSLNLPLTEKLMND